jgi:hypothetical protein
LTCTPKISLGEAVIIFPDVLGVMDFNGVLLEFNSSNWELLIHRWLLVTNILATSQLFHRDRFVYHTARKFGPHTQTDRGTCPGVGL